MTPQMTEEECQRIDLLLSGSLITARTQAQESTPIIMVDDAVVGTAGNFSVSIGKAKSKKTFNVSAMVASALSNRAVLGYKVRMPKGKPAVLYFDTEQSTAHCVRVIRRINRLCGRDADEISHFLYFYGLRRHSPTERLQAINMALEKMGHMVGLVIIDGIRDCLYDINSPAEATSVTGYLLNWTDVHQCHIHTILHQIKSDDNARGHIGTELNNKAETVIKVEKAKDNPSVSVVSPLMCRDKEFAPFAFVISEDGLPVSEEDFSIGAAPQAKQAMDPWNDIPIEIHKECVRRLFPGGKGEYTSGELVERMHQFYKEKYPTIGRDKVKEIKTRLTNKRIIIHKEESQKSPFILNELGHW